MQTSSSGKAPDHKQNPFEKLLDRQQFCQQHGISYRTAEIWAHKGIGPKVTRLGRRAYYHVDDIAEWIEVQRKKSTARFAKAEA